MGQVVGMGLLGKLLGGEKPMPKKSGGHGSHWQTLFPQLDDVFVKALVAGAESSKVELSRKGTFAGMRDTTLAYAVFGEKLAFVYALFLKEVERDGKKLKGLIVDEPFTAYPAYFAAKPHNGTIKAVEEWANGTEAQVQVKLDAGPALWFFATDYLEKKEKYAVGSKAAPKLAGFAYRLNKLGDEKREVTLPDGSKASMDNFAGIIPMQMTHKAGDVDDYAVWAKVERLSQEKTPVSAKVVEAIVAYGGENHKTAISIPIVTTEKTLPDAVKPGEKITGTIWLTGSL
jgi:hypothetical protein